MKRWVALLLVSLLPLALIGCGGNPTLFLPGRPAAPTLSLQAQGRIPTQNPARPAPAAPAPALRQTQGDAWHIETVDGAGFVGEYNSLALDVEDHPHISYWDRDLWALKYAYHDGNGWLTETVDSAGYIVWSETSLAVDSSGRPHITYCASPCCSDCDELRHAWRDGSNWLTETVELHAGGASLALDAAGRPHMAYVGRGGLCYGYYDGTTWITETVDWNGHGFYALSLALDAAGRPHIAYVEAFGLLVYAYYDGAQWVYEELRGVGEGGSFASLALDSSDLPHIAYNAGDWPGVRLGYMHYDGRRWWDETVEGEYLQYVGNGSLALDAGDHPHIVYPYRHDLQYAHHDGAAWWIETVNSYAGSDHNSLALDAAGQGHISYGSGILWYASRLCMPVLGAAIVGPARLPVGATGHYSATAGPLDAAMPITLTWEDGTVGATAAYSWTAVGTATLAVTAANPCGEAQGTFTVTVCRPLNGVVISGPAVLFSGQAGTYQASPQPITATPPFTFTWDNGTVGPSSTYSWAATGDYTLAVTATNDCGTVVGASFQVQVVEWPYRFYLPLIRRE